MTMMMTSHLSRVEKEKVQPCMTCPLCNELYREATTISECLHTFCRKCIYEKIREEELSSCPVCDADLGCAPFDKLRDGDRHLPQISPRYLRVRDGNLLVSHVKKYLAKKLNLGSETQVVISLRGEAFVDSLRMHEVVDIWLKSASTSESIKTYLGSSGKDFVMLLSYALKAY